MGRKEGGGTWTRMKGSCRVVVSPTEERGGFRSRRDLSACCCSINSWMRQQQCRAGSVLASPCTSGQQGQFWHRQAQASAGSVLASPVTGGQQGQFWHRQSQAGSRVSSSIARRRPAAMSVLAWREPQPHWEPGQIQQHTPTAGTPLEAGALPFPALALPSSPPCPPIPQPLCPQPTTTSTPPPLTVSRSLCRPPLTASSALCLQPLAPAPSCPP